jgi:hypothetical protein
MKKILLFAVLSLFIGLALIAQEAKPELLKQPDDWQFERFGLPPSFAPAIRYKGVEELRFAPGMFKKDSADYFTYVFVARLDSIKDISQKDIETYLSNYFKGLCSVTAKDNKLTIDTSKITVSVTQKTTATPGETIYNSSLQVFGVFADGALVKLNMEVKVMKDTPRQRIYLLFIASPQPKSSDIWKTLYRIQKDFNIPGASN